MFSVLYSYLALAYPGNVTANWLVLNRTPSALSSPIIFPTHVACWLLVHFCPLDALYRLLSADVPYRILDGVRGQTHSSRSSILLLPASHAAIDVCAQIAALDNMTTALGYMEYAAEVSVAAGRSCLLHSVLGGMAMNVGGTFIRHFVTHGYEDGVLAMPKLVPIVRTSTVCTSLYYALSLHQRTASNFESVRTRNAAAWQIVTWLAVAFNCLPFLQRVHMVVCDATTDAVAMIARLLGARNHEKSLGLRVPGLAHIPTAGASGEESGSACGCNDSAGGGHAHGDTHGHGHGHGHGETGGGDRGHGHGHGIRNKEEAATPPEAESTSAKEEATTPPVVENTSTTTPAA